MSFTITAGYLKGFLFHSIGIINHKNHSSGSILWLLMLITGISGSAAQIYDPAIQDIISESRLDSLISYVRILSGEDMVWLGNSQVRILNRGTPSGNNLAADYLRQKLESYDLDVYDQVYSPSGRNIYAVQSGYLYPEQQFIICAHYDAVTDHCADDNASGVAAVIEAARILSDYHFKYSLIYALWDEEESGKLGSSHFASQAYSNQTDIRGILDLDMLGWDGNADGMADIHSNNSSGSNSLADLLVIINSLCNLPINPIIYSPGSPQSDHSAFWEYGWSAVLLMEANWGGDLNPFYHTSDDRITAFNLSYFQGMTKLAIATISGLIEGTITQPGWVSQVSGTDADLLGVAFTDPANGIIVGGKSDSLGNSQGVILHTNDGGTTWSSQLSATDKILRAISFGNSTNGIAAGDCGTLLRTADGGLSWTLETGGTKADLFGVSFSDALTGTVVGDSGVILRTTNGGSSWSRQSSGITTALLSVSFADNLTGTAVGADRIILCTSDGGSTWTLRQIIGGGANYGVVLTSPDTGIVIQEGTPSQNRCWIIRTINGGSTWIPQLMSPFYTRFRALSFADIHTGVVVGYKDETPVILRTQDGGLTWISQKCATSTRLRGVSLSNASHGTIVGDGGTIFHTTTGGLSILVGLKSHRINEFADRTVLRQNYPNPFNPVTTIEFDLPESKLVNLKIYTILGEEIATIISERLSAGKYIYEWDASNVASGIYLYRLMTDGFIQTKKMIFIK